MGEFAALAPSPPSLRADRERDPRGHANLPNTGAGIMNENACALCSIGECQFLEDARECPAVIATTGDAIRTDGKFGPTTQV